MCDSIQIFAPLKADISDEEYAECCFPWQPEGADGKRGEFYDFEIKSPLTDAGFLIKAVGVGGIRHGRIGGYWLSVNIPACTVGHNRELVNGVYWAASIGWSLLRYFLASCGCTKKGLSYIPWENVQIGPLTLTFLKECESAEEAFSLINDVRQHAEAILNHGPYSLPGKKKAYVKPEGAEWPDDVFTLYIRDREFGITLYAKQPGVKKAFLKKIDNPELESEVQERSERTVRIEITPHGAWLEANDLDRPDKWMGNPDAYEKVFNLLKGRLKLERKWRVRRIRKSTVSNLALPKEDKRCLSLHIAGEEPADYPVLFEYEDEKARSKRFSAIRSRVFDATGIDLRIPWKVQQSGIRPGLAEVFEYPGEFVPLEHLQEVVYSRQSAPGAYNRLEALTAAELSGSGAGEVAQPSDYASGNVEDEWPDSPLPMQGMFDGIDDLLDD
ncbi:hypothetical protein [Trinickia mobilis]|uniref:hypothetical protein n=1 Tax=Trinickia mobilis TaxID=2816356 RepID=UPI001A8EEEDC|nr:hypothetical protein [Trinickia mobilis]